MRIWCVGLGIVCCLVSRSAYADCAVIPDGGITDDFDGDGLADMAECGMGACPDRDMDGMSDRRDPDDDNDGVLTCEERVGDADTDTDGDGMPDYLDTDDDGDRLPTVSERPDGLDRDTDGDDKPDHLDADDDGDGIPTRDEGAPDLDTDSDKTPDYRDADDDGDGVDTLAEGDASKDSDQDGIPDYLDAKQDTARDGGGGGADGGGASGGSGTGGATGAAPPPGSGISGGGLCSAAAVPSSTSLSMGAWFVCLALLLLRRRLLLRRCLLLLSVLLLALSAVGAQAQVPVESYRASALPRDGMLVPRPEVPGHLRWSVSVAADYATDQVLYRKSLSKKNSDLGAVIGTGVYGHAAFALGLGERIALYAGLPVSLVMSGDKSVEALAPKADGAGLMDAVLGGRAVLYGDAKSKVAVAGELVLRLPTAKLVNDSQVYSGEAYGSAEPSIFADARLGRISLGARAGARFRKPTDVSNIRSEQEILLSGALRVRVIDALEAQLELSGATPFTEVLDRDRSPLEALLGLRAYTGDLHLGAAAGPGISRGFGTPQVRAVVLVGYSPRAGAAKSEEASKPTGPAARVDPDHDGLFNQDDACPTEPEDRDGHDDIDGCPDLDNDEDGVPDAADKCKDELEDTDDFQDGDGCPEADNDADGLNDDVDSCPDQPEDKDGLADKDGCPEEDADGDTIVDKDDACPGEAGEPDALGCPLVMQ